MVDGIRITQAGSSQQRVTQAGDTRITEHAVMAQALLSAAASMDAVPIHRVRSVGVGFDASSSMTAKINGKTTVSAVLNATGTMAAVPVRARRTAGAALAGAPQFFPGIGRTRTMCVHMNTAALADTQIARSRTAATAWFAGASVEAHVVKKAVVGTALTADAAMTAGQVVPLERHRAVLADWATSTTVADIFLHKTTYTSTQMTTAPGATFGSYETGTYRITEDGVLRVTQAGNLRLVEESFISGHILIKYPPFRIYHNSGGAWYVLDPSARHSAIWKLPQAISVHWQGGWHDVKSNK